MVAALPPKRIGDRDALLEGIAVTAAASAAARRVPGVFVVRKGARPALGVIGAMDEAAEARVQALFEQVSHMLETLVYVDYGTAEAAAISLAQRLNDRFPASFLSEATFHAIPRGGHVVLGLFAAAAGIPADQVGVLDPDPRRPLVVLDDCALTGDRFARWLQRCDSRRVVFAPLYAHPGLTRAIEMSEERVAGCVPGMDLQERQLRGASGNGHQWRESWRQRVGGQRYWMGRTDFLAFAWKEPDRSLWNPVTEQLEHGWRTTPAALCLGNRVAVDGEDVRQVQIQTEGPGPIQPGATVVAAQHEGELVVADASEGTALSLDGAAVDMWEAVLAHGNLEGAVQHLARAFDAPVGQVAADTRDFVDALVLRGLLEYR